MTWNTHTYILVAWDLLMRSIYSQNSVSSQKDSFSEKNSISRKHQKSHTSPQNVVTKRPLSREIDTHTRVA